MLFGCKVIKEFYAFRKHFYNLHYVKHSVIIDFNLDYGSHPELDSGSIPSHMECFMKIRFASILVILSVLFFSCRGSVSQDCSGSVTVDSGKVAKYVTQRSSQFANIVNASNSDPNDPLSNIKVTCELKVKLSTEGDYTTTAEIVYSKEFAIGDEEAGGDMSETMFKDDMGKSITLSDIPVGSSIKVKANVSMKMIVDIDAIMAAMKAENPTMPAEYEDYMKEMLEARGFYNKEYELATGTSDSFIVKSGNNTVTISMTISGEAKKDETDDDNDVEFVLYASVKNEYGTSVIGTKYFLADKSRLKSVSTTFPDFDSSSTMNSFCFDSEGYFYALGKDGQDRNVIISDKYNEDKLITDIDNPLSGITIDRETDVLYAWYGMENALTFAIYIFPDFVSSGSVEHTDITTVTFDSTQFGNYAYHKNDKIVVDNEILYGCGCTGQPEISNNKFYTIDLSAVPLAAHKLDIDYSTTNIASNSQITDLLYQDGALYILVKDISSNIFPTYSASFNRDSPIRSRGALIKYTFSTQTTKCLGWTSGALPTTGKYAYGYAYQSFNKKLMTTPDTAGSNSAKRYKESISLIGSNFPSLTVPSDDYVGFYGPRKFVAIKPKRLYIADDGVAFYTDRYGAFNSSNVNRIVAIDLTNFTISNSMDTIVTFNDEETGTCVGGSGFEHRKDNYDPVPTVYMEDESELFWNGDSNDRIFFGFPLTVNRY